MEILAVKDLTFYYPESKVPAIDRFSLSINTGDFFVLCGRSGCGKSTLLRQLKPQLAPHGMRSGDILFEGTSISALRDRESAAKIGFVLQSPDNQIVTDKVWHELAFGLESLGCSTPIIRRRVAEMASFFGIQNWFYKDVSELSGGQKQLLNLASVMVMQPAVLILDEPTSQLDPIAASDFLATLKKINRELGTTIVLTEHRLEEALSMASCVAVMEKGRLLCSGSVAKVGACLRRKTHPMFLAMPAAMRIWGSVDSELHCPVSVREGRQFLSEYSAGIEIKPLHKMCPTGACGDIKISAKDIWFRYEKDLPDCLCGVNLIARSGELLCVLGGNGTGKTTTLKVLSGLYKPYRGEIKTDGKICFLPQDPQTLFVKKTVFEDLSEVLKECGLSKGEREEKARYILRLCCLSGLEDRHPYDLSGGEQQRAALAKLLLLKPDILLLDEPTKGLDAEFKTEFAVLLKELLQAGVCIIMVSHDIEFCAKYADRCALFFDGTIVTEDTPQEFFSGNSFYTTSANRIARGILRNAITTEDVIAAIGGSVQYPAAETAGENVQEFVTETAGENVQEFMTETAGENVQGPGKYVIREEKKKSAVEQPQGLPLWRKVGGMISALFTLCILFYAVKTEKLNEMIGPDGMTVIGQEQLYLYGVLILFLILTAVFTGRRCEPSVHIQTPKEKRRLSKRTLAAIVLILLVVPVTLFVGVVYIGHKQYYLTALAVLVECMLPFFMVFEGRHPKARELVLIAVLCALGIAGRTAFFMLPQFKPVLALTIVAGVALGGETGFLVGAVTMLVSNILFSQGPWTPWQMFAMGIIGFLAGLLYRKGLLRRTKISLCVFGAVCAILVYGGIMNPASALIWGSESLNLHIVAGYYVTGFPMDCVHAAATAIFLWFLAEPMLEKLDRIQVKYGFYEHELEINF